MNQTEESPLLEEGRPSNSTTKLRRYDESESSAQELILITHRSFASLDWLVESTARLGRSSSFLRQLLDHLSRSERDDALLKEGVGKAAFLLRDAVLEDVENPAKGAFDPYANMNDEREQLRSAISVFCHRLCSSRPLVNLFHAACSCLVLLTFVEPQELE
jgi:hypothetical protein